MFFVVAACYICELHTHVHIWRGCADEWRGDEGDCSQHILKYTCQCFLFRSFKNLCTSEYLECRLHQGLTFIILSCTERHLHPEDSVADSKPELKDVLLMYEGKIVSYNLINIG